MIKATYKSTGRTPRVMQSKINEINRDVLEGSVGKLFHVRFRPERFELDHAEEMGYQPDKITRAQEASERFKRAYTNNISLSLGLHLSLLNQKRKGVPLVNSGRTKDRARAVSIKATATRGTKILRMSYPLPAYLNYANANSPLKPADYFRKISDDESDEMSDAWNLGVKRRLNLISGAAA